MCRFNLLFVKPVLFGYASSIMTDTDTPGGSVVSATQFGVGRGEIGVDVWSSCYPQPGRSSDYEAHPAWRRDYLRKSHTVNTELSHAYLLAALPRTTLSNLIVGTGCPNSFTRFANLATACKA
jgi:hypothetical protein